jgi:hypothetical protein
MKPFDLEKALAGEPVCTRDGRPVKIAGFNPDAVNACQLAVWVGNFLYSYGIDGNYASHSHDRDLFMAEKPKTLMEGYAILLPDRRPFVLASGMCIYEAKSAAERQLEFAPRGSVIAKITWEE